MTPNGVVRTYRGKPGCGCGCKGTYCEAGAAATTRRVKELAEVVASGERVEAGPGPETDAGNPTFCLSHENDTRYLWVYFADRSAAVKFIGEALLSSIEADDRF